MEQTPAKELLLKISYCGVLKQIICPTNVQYCDILDLVIERFALPPDCKKMLLLSNGRGYTFDRQLFEYFILLFPTPQITFYLRLDTAPATINKTKIPSSCPNFTILNDKCLNQSEPEEMYARAMPVYRQNCFIGALPKCTSPSRRNIEYSKQKAKRVCTDRVTRKYRPKRITSHSMPIRL